MTKKWLKNKILGYYPGLDFDILIPPNQEMGDYSTSIAFVLAKKDNRNPEEVGKEIIENLEKDEDFKTIFSKIEFAKPGFINFYLNNDFLREQLKKINGDENYGFNETMKGKTVMVEYTDPNPFKLFHIGHLMSNIIGEAIARLYEASGARVLRVNYQGDVGLHVAKAVWGMKYFPQKISMPTETDNINKKIEFLGNAYAGGAKAYENPEFKIKIDEINNKIYGHFDEEINRLYDLGKKWSLEYFENIYKRLGSNFDDYFFESELGQKGLEIVKQHPEVFEKSEGATIFRGEKYDLHTRVFVNSSGLPVYEAKELGLNKEKFDLYHPDLSIIVTGNEINEYFRVLMRVMELTMPDVASRTRHIGHGMLRLPTGKMSSRTGDVITAESLIEQTKSRLPESENEKAREKIAIGAIKYSILKQSPGHDIIFDFDKSLSVKGDSAPYLQYTYARLNSILDKADPPTVDFADFKYLIEPIELALVKYLIKFPDVIMDSSKEITPQKLALYVYELANTANQFYESIRVLDDEDINRRNTRLILIKTVAATLKRDLGILGIETLNKI